MRIGFVHFHWKIIKMKLRKITDICLISSEICVGRVLKKMFVDFNAYVAMNMFLVIKPKHE